MSVVNSHMDNITVSITLSSSPLQEAGFGTVMLLVPQASNSLNAARTVTYTNATDAAADQTAGYISAATLAAVQTAFAQRPCPAQFKVGRVDLGGGETYATGYAAVKLADPDFYGVCITPRTDTEIMLIANAVQSDRKLCAIQSDDSSWLDSGYPAGLTGLEGDERTIICYHTTDAQWMDVAYLCNRLAFDPDVVSAPWNCAIQNVSAYSTAPTQAEKDFLDGNEANNGLPFGGYTFFVDPGVTAANRPIYEQLTADWFATRLEERLASMVASESAAGRKIPVTSAGQVQVLGVIKALFQQGVDAGHFVEGQTEALPVTITSADRTAQRLRFTGRAQLVVNGRIFTFSLDFGTDPLSA